MKIFIGGDHRGFALKNLLVDWLDSEGFEVVDVGAEVYDEGDDYVDFAVELAEELKGEDKKRGVLICGSGVGMSVAVNRLGLRGALGLSVDHVRAARRDDDLEVLVLAAEFVSEDLAREMVGEFIEADFSGEERHVRRLGKVENL